MTSLLQSLNQHSPYRPLDAHQIDIWWIEVPNTFVSSLDSLRLGTITMQRAGRYRIAARRNAFLAGRIALKHMLKDYTGDAKLAVIKLSTYGKPELSYSDLHFSLSYAGTRIAIGFSRTPLGIDITEIRSFSEAYTILKKYAPQLALKVDPQDSNFDEIFAQWWTRREALYKALGLGIGRFDRIFDAQLANSQENIQIGQKVWRILGISQPMGILSAVATEEANPKIAHYAARIDQSGEWSYNGMSSQPC